MGKRLVVFLKQFSFTSKFFGLIMQKTYFLGKTGFESSFKIGV